MALSKNISQRVLKPLTQHAVSPIYLQTATFRDKPRFYILPGGPQNANDKKLVMLNLKAVINRIRLVGVWETIKDFNQSHEINFGETLGTLRGVDEFGNKYYENMDNQFGRHRFVNYAQRRRQADHCTTLPPGWWGWMHHARDSTPADEGFTKNPKWVLLWSENYTGTDKRYLPTNYGQNTSAAWKGMRYSTWNPNNPSNDADITTMLSQSEEQGRIAS